MRIGIIGLGKLGSSLAIGLKKEGFIISGLCSKTDESVNYINSILGENFKNSIENAVNNADIIFVTVPDDAIENVAYEISKKIREDLICGKVFIHCSGVLSSIVFETLKNKGAYSCSLHPMQTFADKERGWQGLYGIYYGFEGDNKAREIIMPIILSFKGKVLDIDKEIKPLYHAAACISSNYLTALLYAAGCLFEKCGVELRVGLDALMPLVVNTINNIKAIGPVNALTGPISRGDAGTVATHIDAMKKIIPELLEIYNALGMLTVRLSLDKGSISKEQALKIENLLNCNDNTVIKKK